MTSGSCGSISSSHCVTTWKGQGPAGVQPTIELSGGYVSCSLGISGSSLVVGTTTKYGLHWDGGLAISKMNANWTNASRTIADLGSVTTCDINGGAIDGATIGANSAAAGTFAALVGTSLSVSDGNITNVGDINCDSVSVDAAGTGLNVDFSGGDTTKNLISLQDNLADALNITEGSNSYLKFVTTNSSEEITITPKLVPYQDSTVDLGTTAKRFATIYVDSIVGGSISQTVESYGAAPLGTTISASTDFALIKSGAIRHGFGGAVYTLPTAVAGKLLHIKLSSSQANVEIKANANDSLEDAGAAGSILLGSTGSAVTLVAYDATHWFII